jgi:hypothetical protein
MYIVGSAARLHFRYAMAFRVSDGPPWTCSVVEAFAIVLKVCWRGMDTTTVCSLRLAQSVTEVRLMYF